MDLDQREALDFLNNYLQAMKSWEERAAASADLARPVDDPARWPARDAFQAELDAIHQTYCQPSEWTEHFLVSSPTFFDVETARVERKSRNRFLVDVDHRSLPLHFRFELRRIDGAWRVMMMWQAIPATGKLRRCFF